MLVNVQNEYGTISIDNEVVAKIAGHATTECYGVVGMAVKNVKDGLVHLLKKESLAKGVKITNIDGMINVDLHIIVEYGTNISAIAESIISSVKYQIESSTGLKVGTVNVLVEGIRVDD